MFSLRHFRQGGISIEFASPAAILAPVSTAEKDRADWPTRRCESFDDMRAYRIRQWQEAGCEARMKAAWELVVDYWVGYQGKDPNELRLQRSVTKLVRAKQTAGRPQDLADLDELRRAGEG